MKTTFKLMATFVCLAALLMTACQKTSDTKIAPANPALEANKAALHASLRTCDLSDKTPGDWWWEDETSGASTSASSRVAGGASSNLRDLITFSYLDSALSFTGLDAVLADPATQYTVFAPSDKAFKDAGFATIDDLTAVGVEALTQILLYHVVSGKIFAADLPIAMNTEVPSLNGASLFITHKNMALPWRKVTVNSAGVYIADVDLGNGVMHDINKVLMPPVGNIVETAVASPDLSYLVAAVLRASTGATDVAAALSGDGPLTVFAPTNQAFMAAGFPTIDAINAADPDALAAILTYHVIAARVFSGDVKDGQMPVMLNGSTTTVWRVGDLLDRSLEIKGNSNASAAMIGARNIVATNGVVHIIDQVLLP